MNDPEYADGPTIDVNATAETIDLREWQRRRGQLALAGRVPAASFSKPQEPEMRGRRPSGQIFQAGDVPPEMQGEQTTEDPPFAVSKRSAKGVAEELTRRPVKCRNRADGMCEIEIVLPLERIAFAGRTWFLALHSLKDWLDRRARAR